MRRSLAVALTLALALSAAPLAAKQKPTDPVAAFDALAARLRGEWQVLVSPWRWCATAK